MHCLLGEKSSNLVKPVHTLCNVAFFFGKKNVRQRNARSHKDCLHFSGGLKVLRMEDPSSYIYNSKLLFCNTVYVTQVPQLFHPVYD